MRHLMKDSKQLLYSGELWVLVGQFWQGDAPAVSFVCASGPNKSLVRNLWEAQAVRKECPLSLVAQCLSLNQSLEELVELGAS